MLSFIVVKHNSRHKPVKQDWNISRFWLEIRHIWQIYLGRKKRAIKLDNALSAIKFGY